MTPADMAAIHRASFVAPRPWSMSELNDILAAPNTHLFEDPYGFAITRHAGPEAELLTIAVDPNQRRQRIARRLMDALISHAKHAGVEEIFLEVAETNEAAISLYKSSGFLVKATRKHYYTGPEGQKISAYIMALSI